MCFKQSFQWVCFRMLKMYKCTPSMYLREKLRSGTERSQSVKLFF